MMGSASSNQLPKSIGESTKSVYNDAAQIAAASAVTTLMGSMQVLADEPKKKSKKPKVKETDLGINYIELKKGSGPYPGQGDFVVVDYTAFLNNGTVFDSTEIKGRKQLSFRFGMNQTIPGVESVLSYMQPGGEATCTIPPKYAYGSKGVCLPNGGECLVPPDETLKYVLKLRNVGAGYN